jgi:hypothetical protein
MGRLRASTATSPLDARIAGLVAAAQRNIAEAMRVAKSAKKAVGVEGARSNRVHRDLAKVAGALQNIRRLKPHRDYDDLDLMSEEDRAQLLRDRLDAERDAEEEEEFDDIDDVEVAPVVESVDPGTD